MSLQMFLALFLTIASLFSSPQAYNALDVKTWCAKTPNPKPCEYFLTQNPKNESIRLEPDFFKISMQLVLERAMRAEDNTRSLGRKCRDEREKAAWEDCVKLYEYTILKLNKTIDPNKCTHEDSQTWLSTALTNLETCRAGFHDLGVPENVLPLMTNNVSMLISNILAMNKNKSFRVSSSIKQASIDSSTYPPPPRKTKTGYPTWVNGKDRRLLQSPSPPTNVVVAQDGSGDYKTVGEAVAAAAGRSGSGRYVIYVKEGSYRENVEIGSKVTNVMLVGDGAGKTIITGSRSVGGGSTTFNSATVIVEGDRFMARDITFRNTAGPQNGQAVALRSGSDLSIFYKCSFEGYQDTLYVHSDRQFYRECDIYGTVDFIFGNAAVVFQGCNIYPRKPPNKTNTITAQSRTDPNQNTGIIIHNCKVRAAPDLGPVQGSVKTYLGRPWREYARTVFMKTALDGLVHPAGWLEWDGNFALSTLYYGEYGNSGAGSGTSGRVKWAGYHIMTESEASQFTVGNFLAGSSWLPATNVPFTAGL